jgi:hypothetical protein
MRGHHPVATVETPMLEPNIAPCAAHSRWSDPGRYSSSLAGLPAAPDRLPGIVSGLVLHPLFAPQRDASAAALRTVREILAAVLQRDAGPLDWPRQPDQRVLATCRSYALLAGAILRQHQIPARVRVGFADYFTPDFWEDHWVCEYHDGDKWRLLDAELAPEVRQRFGIAFDPADVPRDRFLTAGPAWLALRRGEHDPARVGVSAAGLTGLWFAAGSLMRDLAALGMEEMMAWDYWGPSREFRPGSDIPTPWLGRLDSLADALARATADYAEAEAILAAHPWAALTPTILSFPDGAPVEVALDHP